MFGNEETEMLAREAQLIFSNVTGWTMAGGSLRTWRGVVDGIEYEIFLPRMFPKVPPVVRTITPNVSHPDIDKDGVVKLRINENWRVEYHLYQVILQLISLLKRTSASIGKNNTGSQSAPTSPYTPMTDPYTQSPSSASGSSLGMQTSRSLISRRSSSLGSTSRQNISNQAPDVQEMQVALNSEITIMKKELERLKDEITKRDEELTHMRAKEALSSEPISINSTSGESTFKHVTTNDSLAELEAEQIAISELIANLDEKYMTGEASTLEYAKLFKKYSRDIYILNKKIEYIKIKTAQNIKKA